VASQQNRIDKLVEKRKPLIAQFNPKMSYAERKSTHASRQHWGGFSTKFRSLPLFSLLFLIAKMRIQFVTS
jgi:hypothetical protein